MAKKKRPKHPWFHPRYYLHFDPKVGLNKARKIVSNPKKVAAHSFYPLIAYQVKSQKIKRNKISGAIEKKAKLRPIAYAAHLDSHIYSYYAYILSQLYEKELLKNELSDSVLAFRPLGKSNIEFAADAFNEIAARPAGCAAVALDISGFFDNLDHEILKRSWCDLLRSSSLPKDHYRVFRSLTKFSTVNKSLLYEKLGISLHNPRKNNLHRLCDPGVFRDVVRSSGLIITNSNNRGIPQGTPISALASNIYMMGFDIAANNAAKKLGGKYYRYCDDMLFLVPVSKKNRVAGFARENIEKIKLDINTEKTEIREFRYRKGILEADKPLQYLGFTFDGQRILLRSASLARYSERMKRGVRLAKATMRKRNALKARRGEVSKGLFKRKIYQRYSHLGRRNFVRYGLRAADVMGSRAIRRQLRTLWDRLIREMEAD